MIVGRQRVTPVARIASSACVTPSVVHDGVVEVDAGEAVDLQIDETGQVVIELPAHPSQMR